MPENNDFSTGDANLPKNALFNQHNRFRVFEIFINL